MRYESCYMHTYHQIQRSIDLSLHYLHASLANRLVRAIKPLNPYNCNRNIYGQQYHQHAQLEFIRYEYGDCTLHLEHSDRSAHLEAVLVAIVLQHLND